MMTRIHVEYHGHAALLTLDHAPANTLTLHGLQAFQRLLAEVASHPEVVVLVLSGQGVKFFCAGADLKQFAGDDKVLARDVVEAFAQAFDTLVTFPGVTIAVINGYAMGGGLELALACDIRIAEQHAVLALPEASVGLLPCAGGTQRLTELVGQGWAKRMILCGEQVSATQGYEIGLVEQVVSTGQGIGAAKRMASHAMAQSPAALRACKELINQGRRRPRDEVLPMEREAFLALFDDPNQQEGVQAFLEKRAPEWRY